MINITREQFFEFVKTEKDTDDVISKPTKHYLDYFDKYQSTCKTVNWNWAAFWGSIYWFCYRRMYLAAFLVLITSSALSKIFEKLLGGMEDSSFLHLSLLMVFELVLWILTGFYSDYIYLHYASTKFLKGKTRSGVNRTLKFVFLGLLFLMLIALFATCLFVGGAIFKTPS